MTNLIVARGQSVGEAELSDDANMIYNGKFESALIDTDGWDKVNTPGTTMTRETIAPISGVGSLRVHVGTDTGGVGVLSWIVTIDSDQHGQTYRITFDHRGENFAGMVYLDLDGASDIESSTYFTAAASEAAYSWDFVMPDGTIGLQLQIVSDWNGATQGNKTYWLDNIKCVKIADAP